MQMTFKVTLNMFLTFIDGFDVNDAVKAKLKWAVALHPEDFRIEIDPEVKS